MMSKFKKTLAAGVAVVSLMSTVATTAYAEQMGTEFITSMITENLKSIDLDGVNIDSDIKAFKVVGSYNVTDKGMQMLTNDSSAKAVSAKVGLQSLTNKDGDVACQIQARLNGTDVLKATSVFDMDKNEVYVALPGYMKGVAKVSVDVEQGMQNPVNAIETYITETLPEELKANEANMKVTTTSNGYSLVCTNPEDNSTVTVVTDKNYAITDIDYVEKAQGTNLMMDFADNAWSVNYTSSVDGSTLKSMKIDGTDGKITCVVNDSCGFDMVYSVPAANTINTWEMTFNDSEAFFEAMGYGSSYGKIAKLSGKYAYNSKTFMAEESAYLADGTTIFTSNVTVKTSKKTVDFKIPEKAKEYESFDILSENIDILSFLARVSGALE